MIIYFISARNKWALVIGNSNYQQMPELPGAKNDIKTIKHRFVELGFHVLMLIDLTRTEVQNAVILFSTFIQKGDYGKKVIAFDSFTILLSYMFDISSYSCMLGSLKVNQSVKCLVNFQMLPMITYLKKNILFYLSVSFFYAGHGIHNDGIDYIIPLDASLKYVSKTQNVCAERKFETISIDECLSYVWIINMLQKGEPALIFSINDTCRVMKPKFDG